MSKVSLLIAVYERADFLDKVLASLLFQTRQPDEIIVCEDGQSMAVKGCVDRWKKKLSPSVIHITQADRGNRKTLCVNKGIAQSSGDYIVTIDGDCVLHKGFVQAHLEYACEDAFLTGRRVELSELASEALSTEKIENGYLNSPPLFLLWDALWGKTRHVGRFFTTPKWLLGALKQEEILDIRGCNFSVHKRHLISVNGYDNNFSGAYGEDSDLEFRLKRIGLKMKSIKGRAIQYHLWHKEQTHDPKNQERLRELEVHGEAASKSGLREAASID